MLYFAYASNLDEDQLRARCPSARPLDRARLSGHALAFGGFSARWGGAVASVVPARGQAVDGVLYALTTADLRALDTFEGHPVVYEHVVRVVTAEGGARRRAFVYVLRAPGAGRSPPAPRYLAAVRHAYARWRFDPAPLACAAAKGPAARPPASHHRVFVYGSLLGGERNHTRLAGARFVGPARTLARYALHDLGPYPGMTEGTSAVEGELYEVDAPLLAALDRFEAHPTFYRRGPVALEGGALAEGYLLTRAQVASRPLLPSGNWRARAEETKR